MWQADPGAADAEAEQEPPHAPGSNTAAHGRGRTRPGGEEGNTVGHLQAYVTLKWSELIISRVGDVSCRVKMTV